MHEASFPAGVVDRSLASVNSGLIDRRLVIRRNPIAGWLPARSSATGGEWTTSPPARMFLAGARRSSRSPRHRLDKLWQTATVNVGALASSDDGGGSRLVWRWAVSLKLPSTQFG